MVISNPIIDDYSSPCDVSHNTVVPPRSVQNYHVLSSDLNREANANEDSDEDSQGDDVHDEDDDQILEMDEAFAAVEEWHRTHEAGVHSFPEQSKSQLVGAGPRTRGTTQRELLLATVEDVKHYIDADEEGPEVPLAAPTAATHPLDVPVMFRPPFSYYAHDIASLATPLGHVTDTIIDGYLRCVARSFPGVWSVSSSSVQLACSAAGNFDNRFTSPISLVGRRNSGTFLIPLNTSFLHPRNVTPATNDGHWVLMVLQVEERKQNLPSKVKGYYYDSFAGTLNPEHKQLILPILEKSIGCRIHTVDREVVHQINHHDCGVFLCVTALRVLLGKDPTPRFDVQQARVEIQAALEANSARLPSIDPKGGHRLPPPRPPPAEPPVVVVVQTPMGFHTGEERLRFAPITLEASFILTLTPTMPEHPIVRGGLTVGTRRAHLRTIAFLQGLIRQDPLLGKLKLPMFIVVATSKLGKNKWAASTSLKFLVQAMSFFIRLDQYTDFQPIDLRQSKLLSDAVKCYRKQANQDLRKPRPYTTRAQVKSMLQSIKDSDLRCLLIITWATAARPSNTLTLHKANIRLTESPVIYWTHAKTSILRGPYSTPVHLGPHLEEVRNWLATKPSGPLFPSAQTDSGMAKVLKTLRSFLKLQDPTQDMRSLRRGSLIWLAQNGMEDRELMVMSGHTQVSTLRRYLQWQLPVSQAKLVLEGLKVLWE